MLKQFDLNFNSDLKYDNIRHLKTRKLSEIMNVIASSMLALFRKTNVCPLNANMQGCSVLYTTTVNLRINAPHFVLTARRLPTKKRLS